jgi:hypothetical protein
VSTFRLLGRPATIVHVQGICGSSDTNHPALSSAGTPLSRARWHYRRAGAGPEVKKEELLRDRAVFFGVNPDYLLTGGEELPAEQSRRVLPEYHPMTPDHT